MSDATLPAPRSSSAAPHIESRNRSDSSSGEGEFDSTLNSSFSGIGNDLGATDGGDSKQKRKRTSPQDQAILEAEYKQNPKPNKAARAEIVKKVTLNEKEVQIWFQNRRQINRRKSRPLLPHEIAAFGLGGMAALSSDPAAMMSFGSSQGDMISSSQTEALSSQEEPRSSQPARPPIEFSQSFEGTPPDILKRHCAALAEEVVKQALREDDLAMPPSSSSSAPISSLRDDAVTSFTSTPGYVRSRVNAFSARSSSFSTPASAPSFPLVTPPVHSAYQPASCPEKINEFSTTPISSIRLSMSLDGKAELVSNSPSPPRERSISSMGLAPGRNMRGLQRSYSALPAIPPFTSRTSSPSFAPRLPTGRSKDARSWELCCDGETRDELTVQAENESHGSAVAAISLIRSTSSKALKSNTNKRNTPSLQHDSGNHGKRAKVGRAQSSLARLQNPIKPPIKSTNPISGKENIMLSPSGDSDKENWLPKEYEATGNPRRRPLPSSRSNSDYNFNSRTILGDNLKIVTHAGDFGASKRKRKGAPAIPEIFEDEEARKENVRGGDEVEKFMRGEISPSKKGDLDCVQGLLSLSQGNWR